MNKARPGRGLGNCGEVILTTDLQVMSLASYHCSTPRCCCIYCSRKVKSRVEHSSPSAADHPPTRTRDPTVTALASAPSVLAPRRAAAPTKPKQREWTPHFWEGCDFFAWAR